MRRGNKARERMNRIIAILILTIGFVAVMLPLVWMLVSSLKSSDAVNTFPPQWIPKEQV